MPRVGTCKDCGARFKVPDAVHATTAKCAKCGGVVSIPPAGAAAPGAPPAPTRAAPPAPVAPAAPAAARPAAPAARPAAPAAPAARPAAPARAGGPAVRARSTRIAGKEASPEAGAERRPAAAGRRSRGERAAAHGPKKKGPPLPLILGAVVVIGGGLTAWLVLSGDDAPAPPATPAASEAAPADGAAPAAQPPAGAAAPAVPAEAPLAPAPAALEPAAAPAAAAGTEPPAAAAPASSKIDDQTPRDPVVAIEPLGPVPGTTDAQLAEWTALVKSLYIDDPGAKARKKLIAQLEELDIVDATPAYINAMIGLNMSNPIDIRNAGNLIGDWSKRQGVVIRFAFDLEASKTDTLDVNRRVIVVEGWRAAFAAKMASEQSLARYREDVAAKLAAGGAGD